MVLPESNALLPMRLSPNKLAILCFSAALLVSISWIASAADGRAAKPRGAHSVKDRVQQYGGIVRKRLTAFFSAAQVPYPPARLVLLAFKQEKSLEVHAAGSNGAFHLVRAYPIMAASGVLGPKLRQGDGQVPEGIYRIEMLNPNSRFHLSLRLNYPNDFDRQQAKRDGRTNLGGDIMIHGNAVSIGCIAVGDEAAEDLFVLAALTGLKNISVIVSPVDFRVRDLPALPAGTPKWVETLHPAIKREMAKYPVKRDK